MERRVVQTLTVSLRTQVVPRIVVQLLWLVRKFAICTEALYFDTLPWYPLLIHDYRRDCVAQSLSSNSVPAVLEATITNMTSSTADLLMWILPPGQQSFTSRKHRDCVQCRNPRS